MSKLQSFFNKIEITIQKLRSLGTEISCYVSLSTAVLTSKLPTDL